MSSFSSTKCSSPRTTGAIATVLCSTLPIRTAGNFGAAIRDVEVANASWAASHWQTIRQAYRGARHFKAVGEMFEQAYAATAPLMKLSVINQHFLRSVASFLEIETRILSADIVPRTTDDPTQRLLEICRARSATAYVSGPAAHSYLDLAVFRAAGIAVHFVDYSGYPVYLQQCSPFEHGVSIIDALMHCGHDARWHLKALTQREQFLLPAG